MVEGKPNCRSREIDGGLPMAGDENTGRRSNHDLGAGEMLAATNEREKGAARETLQWLGSQIGAAARDRLDEQVRRAAESFLHQPQERIANTAHGIAEALRQTANILQQDDKEGMARYADRAAAQIDRLSGAVRNQHLSDLVAGAASFARRRPTLVVAGAVVAVGCVVGGLLAISARNDSRPVDTP
jgi:hypothetical protein